MIALTFQRAIQDPRSYISNPFGNYYEIRPGVYNYHSSIDVVFREGSIMGCPIHSVSWGQVTYAARVTQPGYTVFGNVLVVKTDLPDGSIVYCRYAHHDHVQVKVGDIVHPGQYLADVSNAFGAYAPHLDFAISPTKVLALTPWDWPGADLSRVYRDYIDPISFVERRSKMTADWTNLNAAMGNMQAAWDDLKAEVAALKQEPQPPAPDPDLAATVNSATGANVRTNPTVNSAIKTGLLNGTKLTVEDSGVDADGHRWMRVDTGPEKAVGGFIAKDLLSFP